MKNETKIQLLPFEIELMCNDSLILTKNAIMQKLKDFLEEIQKKQLVIIEENIAALPGEVLKTSPKVSKGENYKGLPWLVLDFPRHFEHENIFAIRTMFWWGNFFSISIHLSGRYKKQLESKIINNKSQLEKNQFLFCINQNEWEHHFEQDNYKSAGDFTKKKFQEIISKQAFLKLGKKIPLDNINEIEPLLCNNYEKLVKIIC